MTNIVLGAHLRHHISLAKSSASAFQTFSERQSTGQYLKSDSGSEYRASLENRLSKSLDNLDVKINLNKKRLGATNAAEAGLQNISNLIGQAINLEKQLIDETNTQKINSINDQIQELKTQAVSLSESASYRGINLLHGNSSGQSDFDLPNSDLKTIILGKNSQYSNQTDDSTQTGAQIADKYDLSTSRYNVSSAFIFKEDETQSINLLGNNQSIQLHGDASIETTGPNGISVVELDYNGRGRANGGNYVELPEFTVPAAFSMGIWARYDTNLSWGRVFDLSNNGDISDSINLTRNGTDSSLAFAYRTTGWRGVTSNTGFLQTNEWAYWMVTLDETGAAALYKDGAQVATADLGITPQEKLRTDNYIGASYIDTDPTTDGAFGDFVVIDGALNQEDAQSWFNDTASRGLETSFAKTETNAEQREPTLQEIKDSVIQLQDLYAQESFFIEIEQQQITQKMNFMQDDIQLHTQIDFEKNSVLTKLSEMRSNLANSSLSMSLASHNHILQLF